MAHEGAKRTFTEATVTVGDVDQGTPNAGGASSWPVDVQRVGGVAITQGQKAMAASVPVVIASDQTAVPVSGTVSVSEPVTVDGTVALDAATLAALESITVSGTVSVTEPVSIDDNGGSITVDAVSLPLPTGASTEAKQDTGNASLATIAGNRTANSFTVIASGTGDETGLAAASNLRLMGFSICETASVPALAHLILRHGTSATDPIISQIKLAPGESIRDWFGDQGIAVASGVYIDRVTGTTQVTLYHRTEA